MKTRIAFTASLAIGVASLCFTVPAYAAQTDAKKPTTSAANGGGNTLSMKDKSFMQEAAKGGMMEVEMGRMAQQQGKSADVKKIGSRMVADHGKASSELMAIAKKKGVNLGDTKPKMAKLDSANFDKEYVAAMVKDHEKDLASFQSEAQNGGDPEVKAFASKTSEVIKKHLAMVKDAQSKMK